MCKDLGRRRKIIAESPLKSQQQPTGEDGHCGGLPCSIVTQKSSDLPLVHVEGEVINSL